MSIDLSRVKPFQVILFVVFGAFALIGLIVFANFGGFKNSGSADIGKVTIWGTLPINQVTAAINSLQSGNTDYASVSYVQKSENTLNTDLAEAIATGSGPDLLLISQEELITLQNKLQVIPSSTISERAYLDAYLPIDELFLASQGTYGIPFAVDPLVLYYNRTLLTSAGVALPPTTWEGVTGLAEQLSHSESGTVTQSTIPYGTYDNNENGRAVLSLLLLQSGSSITQVGQNGPRSTLADASSGSDASPAASAMNFYTQFADPVKTVYSWNRTIPSARQAFVSGTLVFYPGFASERPALAAANPNLDFDMAPIPQPQTGKERITYAKAYAFAVPKASGNAGGAVATALALANSSRAEANAQALSMAPATRASLTPSNTDKYQSVYFPQALFAKGWLSPSPQATDGIFSTMITNITSGKMGAGQALYTASQAIDAAL